MASKLNRKYYHVKHKNNMNYVLGTLRYCDKCLPKDSGDYVIYEANIRQLFPDVQDGTLPSPPNCDCLPAGKKINDANKKIIFYENKKNQ